MMQCFLCGGFDLWYEPDEHFMEEDGAPRGEETKLTIEDLQDRRSNANLEVSDFDA